MSFRKLLNEPSKWSITIHLNSALRSIAKNIKFARVFAWLMLMNCTLMPRPKTSRKVLASGVCLIHILSGFLSTTFLWDGLWNFTTILLWKWSTTSSREKCNPTTSLTYKMMFTPRELKSLLLDLLVISMVWNQIMKICTNSTQLSQLTSWISFFLTTMKVESAISTNKLKK